MNSSYRIRQASIGLYTGQGVSPVRVMLDRDGHRIARSEDPQSLYEFGNQMDNWNFGPYKKIQD